MQTGLATWIVVQQICWLGDSAVGKPTLFWDPPVFCGCWNLAYVRPKNRISQKKRADMGLRVARRSHRYVMVPYADWNLLKFPDKDQVRVILATFLLRCPSLRMFYSSLALCSYIAFVVDSASLLPPPPHARTGRWGPRAHAHWDVESTACQTFSLAACCCLTGWFRPRGSISN
jgi:hypothetical protein